LTIQPSIGRGEGLSGTLDLNVSWLVGRARHLLGQRGADVAGLSRTAADLDALAGEIGCRSE
jgi:hypothetical protein